MKRRLIIGVTGGIATGKSFVVDEFRRLGAAVVDADLIARQVLDTPAGVKHAVNRFGRAILKKDGTIDRKKLGKIVFSDGKKLRMLEKLTHPGTIRSIINQVRADSRKNITVLDAPLLFEKKLEKIADFSILIFLPQKIQVERLIKRNGFSKNEALRRISSQMPMSEKVKKADMVIDNTRSRVTVRKEIHRIWKFFAIATPQT